MDIIKKLQNRKIIDNLTSVKLNDILKEKKINFYVGFDPTAASIHVGQLVVINLIRLLQTAGHTPTILLGGASGQIGDPGGKDKERILLNKTNIQNNLTALSQQFDKLFANSKTKYKTVNNLEWLSNWSYLDFLREVGKHFSVNQMIARDFIKSRLQKEESGISYTEFSYILIQAYDFYHLNKEHDCILQIGGSDQWGNIVSGVEYIRKKARKEAYGLTFPLLTKADGSKFGKSESGTIWLDPKKTSPFEFYQFFLRTEDESVIRYINVLTMADEQKINELTTQMQNDPHLRLPQKFLATYLTELVHGEAELNKVIKASNVIYGGSMEGLDDDTISQIFKDVPHANCKKELLTTGWPLIEALTETKAAPSKGQARKLINGGGIYISNKVQKDSEYKLTTKDLSSASYIVLRKGKKHYYLIKFT